MYDLVWLFLRKESKSIWSRMFALAIIAVLFLIVDAFTSYPSLSFTHDKYETIQIMSNLLKDSTITNEQKTEIREELNLIFQRKSLRDVYHSFGERNKKLISNISNVITPFEATNFFRYVMNGLFVVMSWILFLLCSNGLFLLLITFSFLLVKKEKRVSVPVLVNVLIFVVAMGVISIPSYLIMLFLNPSKDILLNAFISQAILFIIISISGQILFLRKRWKANTRLRRV